MSIIWTRDGLVEDDPWIMPDAGIADERSVVDQATAGTRLLSLAEALERRDDDDAFGVVLQPAEDARALTPLLDRLAIVALTFPAFSDGRAFSQAMLLRDRLGYRGDMRAVGTVLLDQVPLMLRVGFSSFMITHPPTLARLRQNRLPGIDLHYQPSADAQAAGSGYSWRRTASLNG